MNWRSRRVCFEEGLQGCAVHHAELPPLRDGVRELESCPPVVSSLQRAARFLGTCNVQLPMPMLMLCLQRRWTRR